VRAARPIRILRSALLSTAFLAAALSPCPPSAGGAQHAGAVEHAGAMEHPQGCPMHEATASVSPACPCGCGERAPLAGSSARLGVALPSTALGFELVWLPAQGPAAVPLAQGGFLPEIDHVPLPA
jgi:hypothetical protein